MCTPQTYYTIHLKGYIVLLHGKLFLLKIYLAAAVIGMVPVNNVSFEDMSWKYRVQMPVREGNQYFKNNYVWSSFP